MLIACCGMPNATPDSAVAATIATIAKVMLWFISQRLSPTILYLQCFTASARTVGEIVDIFNDYYIHKKNYSYILT